MALSGLAGPVVAGLRGPAVLYAGQFYVAQKAGPAK